MLTVCTAHLDHANTYRTAKYYQDEYEAALFYAKKTHDINRSNSKVQIVIADMERVLEEQSEEESDDEEPDQASQNKVVNNPQPAWVSRLPEHIATRYAASISKIPENLAKYPKNDYFDHPVLGTIRRDILEGEYDLALENCVRSLRGITLRPEDRPKAIYYLAYTQFKRKNLKKASERIKFCDQNDPDVQKLKLEIEVAIDKAKLENNGVVPCEENDLEDYFRSNEYQEKMRRKMFRLDD